MHFKIGKRHGQTGWVCYRYEAKKRHYVPQSAWPFGLSSSQTIDEARAVIRSLNAAHRIKEQEARKARIHEELQSDEEKHCAWLPQDVVKHFLKLNVEPFSKKPSYAKFVSSWKLAKKAIIDVNIDPGDWPDAPTLFYDWWLEHPRSADYVRRVFRLINKYGRRYCRMRGLPFEPMPLPPEAVMEDIAQRFEGGRISEPLLPEHLPLLKNKLSVPEYHWVYVCFAFGLRPGECDLLKAPQPEMRKNWWVEDGGKTLVIDQPKLRKIRLAKRYKRIPVINSFQDTAMGFLEKEMKRPSLRKVQTHFPSKVTLYGCRHGFTRLLDQQGHDIKKISKWLGHRSLATTEKYYRDHGLLTEADKAA